MSESSSSDDVGEHEVDKLTANKNQSFYSRRKHHVLPVIIAIIAVVTVATAPFQEVIKCFQHKANDNLSNKSFRSLKKFWAYGKNIESGYLHNVFMMLDRMGYINDPNSTDWDLLWAHDYPFRTIYSKLNNLKPHQKINKLPGSGYITNKVDLATSSLKYIPPAFRLPEDKEKFLEYVQSNNAQFVEKSNDHRNIHIRKVENIDLNGVGKFIQKYVDDPLLIDGYKFDIGIYTIITSVDPLRVYVYNDDALLRFCPVKYEPFDPENVDKYVVGDDYLPTWEVPHLKLYYNILGYGMKESLNAYLRSTGRDPSTIWTQIEDSIRIVILAKEQQIINILNKFPSKRNFFEMMRFDFVVTSDLRVFLMEANMSPNLSSAHFPQNQLLFEQVLFNLFGIVGISDPYMVRSTKEDSKVAEKNIMVFSSECSSALCRSSCTSPICQLCRPCLSEEMRAHLIQAYKEHTNRGSCKRIFPPSLEQSSVDIYNLEEYSAENQLQYRWFIGKCLIDISWCT